jgi:hypothetical protein
MSVVGLIGTLIVGTRGSSGPGEVLVKIRGGSETFLAWSDAPIPKGAAVLVVESRGARTLGVVTWSGGSTPVDTVS